MILTTLLMLKMVEDMFLMLQGAEILSLYPLFSCYLNHQKVLSYLLMEPKNQECDM